MKDGFEKALEKKPELLAVWRCLRAGVGKREEIGKRLGISVAEVTNRRERLGRSRRGKVEARGVVKHKLCGLALNRHKIRPIQELNRFVQPEAPLGMRHSSKRGLDGCPFNQFGQRRDHAKRWKSDVQNQMTTGVAPQAHHKQRASRPASFARSIHRVCRNR